jgi:hypothetical protein
VNLNLKKYIGRLDLDNFKEIICLTFRNYRPDLKIHFLPGAMEINTYQANKEHFSTIEEFYTHIRIMPYLNYVDFDIPSYIVDEELNFEFLSQDRFVLYANSYLDSFKGLSGDNFWKCVIDVMGFVKGYKLKTIGSELVLLGEFDKYYFSFVYQSID